MPGFTSTSRHRVAVLVRAGVRPMELGLIHQLFGVARSSEKAELYEVLTCSPQPGDVPAFADFSLSVAHGTDILEHAQTVVIPVAQEDYQPLPGGEPSAQMREAFARIRTGTRIASVCTGAFALAAAGLLDGRRATTHWNHSEAFRSLYPTVDLVPDVLYVDEGDVLTSGGEAAGIDMCLHMIRRDHGTAVANAVARTTVVPPHRDGGQAQFIRLPVPAPSTGGDRCGTGVGAVESPPLAAPRGARGARDHECAYLHAEVPRPGRDEPRAVADPAAHRTGAGTAGGVRSADRRGSGARGLRDCDVDAPAFPGRTGHDSECVSPDVPGVAVSVEDGLAGWRRSTPECHGWR